MAITLSVLVRHLLSSLFWTLLSFFCLLKRAVMKIWSRRFDGLLVILSQVFGSEYSYIACTDHLLTGSFYFQITLVFAGFLGIFEYFLRGHMVF